MPRGVRIIDYGCGHGEVVAKLARLGFEVQGIDIAEAAIAKARSRYPGIAFHLESEWKPNNLADVCICFEVIEHVLEPRRLLECLASQLRRGGRLALSTPYHGLLKNLALVMMGFDRHFDVEGGNIRFFSDAALRRLLHETGFEVKAIRHFGRLPGFQADSFVWAVRH